MEFLVGFDAEEQQLSFPLAEEPNVDSWDGTTVPSVASPTTSLANNRNNTDIENYLHTTLTMALTGHKSVGTAPIDEEETTRAHTDTTSAEDTNGYAQTFSLPLNYVIHHSIMHEFGIVPFHQQMDFADESETDYSSDTSDEESLEDSPMSSLLLSEDASTMMGLSLA